MGWHLPLLPTNQPSPFHRDGKRDGVSNRLKVKERPRFPGLEWRAGGPRRMGWISERWWTHLVFQVNRNGPTPTARLRLSVAQRSCLLCVWQHKWAPSSLHPGLPLMMDDLICNVCVSISPAPLPPLIWSSQRNYVAVKYYVSVETSPSQPSSPSLSLLKPPPTSSIPTSDLIVFWNTHLHHRFSSIPNHQRSQCVQWEWMHFLIHCQALHLLRKDSNLFTWQVERACGGPLLLCMGWL